MEEKPYPYNPIWTGGADSAPPPVQIGLRKAKARLMKDQMRPSRRDILFNNFFLHTRYHAVRRSEYMDKFVVD